MADEATTILARVSLDDVCFVNSVQRYIDEDKPDALQRKQMEAWQLEWKHTEPDSATSLSFEPTHALTGTLDIRGEFLVVTLSTECYWKGDCTNGSLFFSCHASARFATEPERGEAERSGALSKKESKKEAKIRLKMEERFRLDDYIVKLLGAPMELCQASVAMRSNQLEERVHCSEVTAEAVRRAVFSTSESPLDVFDLVCRLPLLPGTAHSVQHTTALADRAKLRLLEDATYDACENDEEDEAVEVLKLDNGTDAKDDAAKKSRTQPVD